MRLPFANANAPAATRRRWLDADLSRLEAYQRTGKGLLQTGSDGPWPAFQLGCPRLSPFPRLSSGELRKAAVQLSEQGFELAKLGRSLMPEAVDAAHQEP